MMCFLLYVSWYYFKDFKSNITIIYKKNNKKLVFSYHSKQAYCSCSFQNMNKLFYFSDF